MPKKVNPVGGISDSGDIVIRFATPAKNKFTNRDMTDAKYWKDEHLIQDCNCSFYNEDIVYKYLSGGYHVSSKGTFKAQGYHYSDQYRVRNHNKYGSNLYCDYSKNNSGVGSTKFIL